ncbi:MAG TPA: hypothetical protein DCS93_27255 [Microscillaceae bacterium]|nr:hypothetical protein [Microscillaceae bacterium]
MNIKESDWKIFKEIKKKAVDKFCQKALDDFRKVMDNEEDSAHERYGKLYGLVEKRDKLMADLFDQSHSRSGAPLQLLGLRANNLVDEELLAKLSEDLRGSTNPRNFSL